MEISLLKDVVFELQVLKWVLIAVLVVLLLLLLTFHQTLKGLAELMSDSTMESKRFQSECQDLSDRSRYKELRGVCERRMKSHPEDKWALYFLGLALLRLEKYV